MPERNPRLDRTRLLLGDAGMDRLAQARVAVFGLGGVGSYAAEAIARSGVGALLLVDHDRFDVTNQNRQRFAADSTAGTLKAVTAAAHLRDANPGCAITHETRFADADSLDALLDWAPTHIIDAIDSVTAKVHLLATAHARRLFAVASMGAGCRFDPAHITVADIADTHSCGLAKVVRRELRRRGVEQGIPCVFSSEPAAPSIVDAPPETDGAWHKTRVQGTMPYLPAMFGLTAASVVLRHAAGLPGPGNAAKERS